MLAAAGGGVVALAGGNRVERHDLLTDKVSTLSIDAGAGDVTIRAGGPPDTVEVTRKTRSANDLTALAVTGGPTDGTLSLGCASGCDIDYEIRLPAGVTVTVQTGSGDIELEGILGPVSLQTGSGDVDADIVTSGTLTTRTGSGDMDLRLASAPSLISAKSGSGDVDIEVPNDQRYDVDAQTGSGDRDIVVQRQDDAEKRIQIETGSGDITVQGR